MTTPYDRSEVQFAPPSRDSSDGKETETFTPVAASGPLFATSNAYVSNPPPLTGSGESFFFNDTATTEIYTLSLHDALPISLLGSVWSPLTVASLEYRPSLAHLP